MKKNHQHVPNKCIYQATVEVRLPSSTLKKMIMCIWSYSMDHYRKHLQCLMAGSKIQVKMYIHFHKKFTFTSLKEFNPKTNQWQKNKKTKQKQKKQNKTNKPQTVAFVIACFFFICIYGTLYFQNTYLHFTPFVQRQTVQMIYTLLQIMEFMTKFLTPFQRRFLPFLWNPRRSSAIIRSDMVQQYPRQCIWCRTIQCIWFSEVRPTRYVLKCNMSNICSWYNWNFLQL